MSLIKPKPDKTTVFKKLVFHFLLIFVSVTSLFFFENTAFFKQIKDAAFDYMMFWHSDFAPTLQDNQAMQQMVLFDVDDQSYRAWKSPLITPRDKLQALIQKAIDSGAKVIGVDISLSWTSDGDMREHSDSPADLKLAHYLQSLNESQATDAPLIFLTRHYRPPLEKTARFLERPPIFLDQALPVEKQVFWTSTFFKMDEDRVIRRWQLAPLVCQNGRLSVVPSMALLMTLAHLHTQNQDTREAVKVIRDFKTAWETWAKQFSCDEHQGKSLAELCQIKACPNFTLTLPEKPQVTDTIHHVDLLEGYETEKVIYRFAPPDTPQSGQKSLFEVKSAKAILSGELAVDVAGQMVFIGVTHQDNGDYHPIPIRYKDVSGVYILANAVDTLLRFGQFQPQARAEKVKWLIVLVIVMTLIFTFLSISIALGLSFVILCTLIVSSFYHLHYGIEIDFVLELLTIQIIQSVYWLMQKGRQVRESLKGCRFA
jgi:CHASE2 domain-containing sensor protein